MGVLNKVKTAIKTFQLFQNWHAVLLGQFGLVPNDRLLYRLRNGIGFKMLADKDYSPILEIWLNKVYTPSGDEIKEGYTVVDIGAHVGVFSVFATTRSPRVRVISYEPHPRNFALLKENIGLNHLENITAFQLAVSDKSGIGKLFVSPKSVDHSLVPSKERGSYIEVTCVTLDEILGKVDQCHLLKMDCEGAEYDILFNTTEKLLSKVKIITAECHESPELASRGHDSRKLKACLEDKGFKVTLTYLPKLPHAYLYATRK